MRTRARTSPAAGRSWKIATAAGFAGCGGAERRVRVSKLWFPDRDFARDGAISQHLCQNHHADPMAAVNSEHLWSPDPSTRPSSRCSALCGIAACGALRWHLPGRKCGLVADPPSCQTVRLSDIGQRMSLRHGAVRGSPHIIRPTITVLSVPVTYASMKNKDIDVFLGNWMPAQNNDRKPYVADGSVEVIRANLEGAKYTLAVPAYTYAAGLHDFSDISRFGDKLNHQIYGIESGNDGNSHVLKFIRDNDFGLGNFKLVESSETGMLAQVERAYNERRPIVFLGWDPHPMNMRFDMRYLTGGDATLARITGRHHLHQCPYRLRE
jgi:choline ABC transporter choline binding protein